jgi:EAL domain-containing protein (putative c-di-GMP-specific phosphodiesterase class I)
VLTTGSLFAYEALVRCRKPELANPLVLFERAVAAGCAGRLGRMIREIAMPLAAGLPLFLNVHPQELQERWLVRPDDPIYQHDSEVFLEITESVPLTHFELCIDVLREVRDRSGIHLVVDDLGAGYSNLKRIADLAPQVVKIDRGLVYGVDRNPRQHQLVTSVVRLCTDLHAVVVAEGIETEDELRALSDTGAHYGQGFLFARPAFPMPAVTWPPSAPRSLVPFDPSLSELRRRAGVA